jgi:hypothetical protein
MAISKIKSGSLQPNIKLQGDVVDIPGGTTAQRNNSPEAGQVRFNESVRKLEVYNGAGWDSVNPQSLQIALAVALA